VSLACKCHDTGTEGNIDHGYTRAPARLYLVYTFLVLLPLVGRATARVIEDELAGAHVDEVTPRNGGRNRRGRKGLFEFFTPLSPQQGTTRRLQVLNSRSQTDDKVFQEGSFGELQVDQGRLEADPRLNFLQLRLGQPLLGLYHVEACGDPQA